MHIKNLIFRLFYSYYLITHSTLGFKICLCEAKVFILFSYENATLYLM